jgi:hypothetical protein
MTYNQGRSCPEVDPTFLGLLRDQGCGGPWEDFLSELRPYCRSLRETAEGDAMYRGSLKAFPKEGEQWRG